VKPLDEVTMTIVSSSSQVRRSGSGWRTARSASMRLATRAFLRLTISSMKLR